MQVLPPPISLCHKWHTLGILPTRLTLEELIMGKALNEMWQALFTIFASVTHGANAICNIAEVAEITSGIYLDDAVSNRAKLAKVGKRAVDSA